MHFGASASELLTESKANELIHRPADVTLRRDKLQQRKNDLSQLAACLHIIIFQFQYARCAPLEHSVHKLFNKLLPIIWSLALSAAHSETSSIAIER